MTMYVLERPKICRRYAQAEFDNLLDLSFNLARRLHIALPQDKQTLKRALKSVDGRLDSYKEAYPEEYDSRIKGYAKTHTSVG